MNADILNKRLIEAIKEKLPDGVNIAHILMDILCIGKEAMYRRLRGDVPFSFYEVSQIAKKLNISINELFNIESLNNEYLFYLRIQQFYNAKGPHYDSLQAFVDSLDMIKEELESEFVSSSNGFPPFPGHLFPELFKFSAFKSMYEDMGVFNTKLYKEIDLPKEYINLNRNIILQTFDIKKTTYIWRNTLLSERVNEIKFFESLGLIDKEDIKLIKRSLSDFIDFIEDITISGNYKPTGNKVEIYISYTGLDASYYYLEARKYYLSMVGAFSFNHLTSTDKETLEMMKKKAQSLKRISTLISKIDERQRVQFIGGLRDSISIL